MDAYALTASSLVLTNEFEMHDFIEDPNFDQFVELIRGENENSYAVSNFGLINNIGCFVDKQIASAIPGDVFDFNPSGESMVPDTSNYIFSTMPSFNGEMNEDEEDGDDGDDDGEESSGTTTTTTAETKKKKVDRSKTLISERRRRGRMKEKLYALRSLVPNITKMDKASIIGDAVLYVQDLQLQARRLKAEIAGLEASLAASERYQESIDTPKNIQFAKNRQPVCKKIMQMDVLQVEERGFYIKLVCNRGEGVAVSLYKAVESLTSFQVQNSNLATVCGTFVLTFSLNVRGSKQAINLPNLKEWMTGALLNQGPSPEEGLNVGVKLVNVPTYVHIQYTAVTSKSDVGNYGGKGDYQDRRQDKPAARNLVKDQEFGYTPTVARGAAVSVNEVLTAQQRRSSVRS